MANKLDLEINSSQAKSELAGLKAELAQLIQQAQTLKSALSDATGTQRGVIQGALAGTMNRIGALNTSLETAQTSSVIGGVANNPAAAAGVLPSGGFGAGGTGASGVISVSGVAPMNPGTAAGQFGASGYTPTMRFAPGMQPGIAAPVQPTVMMGLPAFVSAAQIAATPTVQMPAQQTIAFTPQQAAAAAYGVPPSGGGQSFFGNSRRYNFGVFVGSVALAGAESAGGFIEYQAQRERVGGVDYTAQGRNVSSSISAAAGAIAFGATGNPYIGALVYGASNAILGPIADKITAPWQNRADANVSLAGFFGSRYGMGGVSEMQRFTTGQERINPFAFGPPTITEPSRLQRITDTVNRRFANSPEMQAALPGVAQTFGTVAGTLFNFGIDPFGRGEPVGYTGRPGDMSVSRPFANWGGRSYTEDFRDAADVLTRKRTTGFALIEGLVDISLGAIKGMRVRRRGGGTTGDSYDETIAETYTRRLGLLFGKDSADAAKRIGPGFDPFLGGNTADILGKLGASDTLAYLRIHNKDLSAGIDENLLSQVAGTSRSTARAVAMGGLQPLGSGRAQAMAFAAEGTNLARLPGGVDSLAYAQAYAGFRGARGQAFEQETLSGFGLRDLALHGEQQRQQYMPFAPGNVFATSLGIIANNRRQIGRLQTMLGLPDLSESERYGLEGQRQGLMTENARNVGMLSEGFENRLPALAAGRPEFAGRYNSEMGAAINLGRIGSPIRAYGATGASRGAQEAFVRGLGGDTVPGAMSPTSRTLDLNTTNGILERILQAITANGGHVPAVGHNRPTDDYGRIQGPNNKDISQQQRTAWNSH